MVLTSITRPEDRHGLKGGRADDRLLGRYKWWVPRWLDRLLPHLDSEEPTVSMADGHAPPPATSLAFDGQGQAGSAASHSVVYTFGVAGTKGKIGQIQHDTPTPIEGM
jgi:hypothetical protein